MKKVLVIEGMMCGHCTGRVKKALEALEGIKEVVMSLEEKTATVDMDDNAEVNTLTEAVTAAGYKVLEVR